MKIETIELPILNDTFLASPLLWKNRDYKAIDGSTGGKGIIWNRKFNPIFKTSSWV